MTMTKTLMLAAAMTVGIVSAGDCLAQCRSDVMGHFEEECRHWREQLPRPDLYSRCQDGYASGRLLACEVFCSANPDEEALATDRLDSCNFLRGSLPGELMTACLDGYSRAHGKAREVARFDPGEDSSRGGKKKISVKKAQEGKNVLEQAREEAQAAFAAAASIDTRTGEL